MSEELLLIGFGKYSLKEILSWKGTDKEEKAIKSYLLGPARFRRQSICTQEDIELVEEYLLWVSENVKPLHKEVM